MQIKTVETTAEEYTIKFDRKYPYMWLKNMGNSDVYISDKPGITAEGDGVSKLGVGESMMVYSLDDSVYVLGATTIEAHGQEFADSPFGDTVISGSSPSPTPPEPSVTVEPLNADQNGVYTAPEGTAYSPVTVDADMPEPVITPLSVSENGTYTVPTGVDGFGPVTVAVPSGFTRTVLYDSGSYNQGAPYQTDVPLLDNLSKYAFVVILTGNPRDNAEISGYNCDAFFADVVYVLGVGTNRAHYAGYQMRWCSLEFTDTTFNQVARGANNESSDYAPQIYKIIGYKF